MVGISLALGVDVFVGSRLGAGRRDRSANAGRAVHNEFRQGLAIAASALCYAQVKVTQARQTAACIASHRFEQRLPAALDDRLIEPSRRNCS